MNEDLLNVMGSFIDTESDAFEQQHKELEKYKNIVEELEEWLNEQWKQPAIQIYVSSVVEKIQELKGGVNNE